MTCEVRRGAVRRLTRHSRSLARMIVLFIILGGFHSLQANHRVIAGSWCGDEGNGGDNSFWNDLCLNDSICRTELQVDTIVDLFHDGTPVRGGQRSPNYFPKYRISFVDDTASLAKLDSVTSYWANTLDSTDILYFVGMHFTPPATRDCGARVLWVTVFERLGCHRHSPRFVVPALLPSHRGH